MMADDDVSSHLSPRALGFRMPAEWEPHEATWLSWPHRKGRSFPGDSIELVLPTMFELVEALASSGEAVCINTSTEEERRTIQDRLSPTAARCVRLFEIPTNEPWCRDHGAIFVTRPSTTTARTTTKAATIWEYNGWGGKYPPYDLDNAAAGRMAAAIGAPAFATNFILEGGAIDTDGNGTLLASQYAILERGRNEHATRAEAEAIFLDQLGIEKTIWLTAETAGDDTDGHVDCFARFYAPGRIGAVVSHNASSPDYGPLKDNLQTLESATTGSGAPFEIAELPSVKNPLILPSLVDGQDVVLPASYANFYVANKSVIVPVFRDEHDDRALSALEQCFPDRRIIPLDCTQLIRGLGAIHCLTQPLPTAPGVPHTSP